MKSEKDWKNIIMECSVLTFIIIVIWSITCGTKGIWPFGQRLLDISDMSQQYIPAYIHLWDVLHGQKSLMFDWNTGLGNNMTGAVLHFGLISPFNVFFLFVKRSAIESSMSIYILFKLIATGLSMRFIIKKWFLSLSKWMCISFSLLYVFSVFNMQYYYAVMWLDISFMFPLIMYGYFLLMNEKRTIPYIISLTITCMMNFQHSCMIFLMLLLLTGILPLISKSQYQNQLIRLLGSTFISMMIAAWIWFPGSYQILHAARLSAGFSLAEIWDSIWIFFTAKWMKLLNTGIPLSLFLLYFRRHLRQKDSKFFGVVIAMLGMPIVFESTNLLWHGGSYQGYTMRFAYMLTFWILTAGAYAYDKGVITEQAGMKSLLSRTMGIVSLLLLSIVTILQYFVLKSAEQSVYKDEIPSVIIILIIVISIIASCGLSLYKKEIYEKFVFAIIICSILTLSMNTIIVSGIKGSTFISMFCEAAEKNIDRDNSNPLIRIKSLDSGLSHNYPMIMVQNAVSNYLVANSSKQMEEINRMGYAKVGLRMSDYGGTLFTDALLGVDEVINSGQANESIYEYEKTYGSYNIYKSLYGYEQGIRLQNISLENVNGSNNPLVYQNQIAQKVVGDELLDITASHENEIGIEVNEKSILYLYAEHAENLDAVTVTDLGTGENIIFKLPESGWLNGILELGTWEDASLSIQALPFDQIGELSCAVLPLQGFITNEPNYFQNYTITRKAASLQISLEGAQEGDYLFLPLYHDNGWKCTINSQQTNIEEFANYFITIPLQTGKNNIVLSFTPTGLIFGIVITLTGILLLIAVCFCKYPAKKELIIANSVLLILDEAIFGILLLVLYIIPSLFMIKKIIKVVFE